MNYESRVCGKPSTVMLESAFKYFTGKIATCRSVVYPYLLLGNNTGNSSSSRCLSSINEAGCLFSPGAMPYTSFPVDCS